MLGGRGGGGEETHIHLISGMKIKTIFSHSVCSRFDAESPSAMTGAGVCVTQFQAILLTFTNHLVFPFAPNVLAPTASFTAPSCTIGPCTKELKDWHRFTNMVGWLQGEEETEGWSGSGTGGVHVGGISRVIGRLGFPPPWQHMEAVKGELEITSEAVVNNNAEWVLHSERVATKRFQIIAAPACEALARRLQARYPHR